jgi:putative DNA primase/helicase
MMERDEMSLWFRAMGREENAEARRFFVAAWSGASFRVDRIERGTIMARDMRLSIIGAIQPGPLAHIMRGARSASGDDGLIERFLISWPDDPGDWRDVDRFPDGPARARVLQSFSRLDLATPETLRGEWQCTAEGDPYGAPFLRLEDGARELFGEWRADLERRLRGPEVEATEAALSKFRHHVPALALTLHLADSGTGPVTEAAMERALALAEYFESHAKRLHASGRRASVKAARLIVDKARRGELADPFTARDVYRPQWAGLTDREIVADALDMLVGHGWLTEATLETGGRPTAIYSLTESARHG